MQTMQEQLFGVACDYRAGSPHLQHWRLYDRLVLLLRDAIDGIVAHDLPLTILEIGAGHGGFTEPALAAGCSVTATEMSRPSLSRLTTLYRNNPNFSAVFDPGGSLTVVDGSEFSLIVCASVLHHIPDYVTFVNEAVSHLAPGGAFFSIQDPMWYAGLALPDTLLTKLGYFAWRISQGHYLQGLQTRFRRLHGVYDEQNPHDMVEYHVVRQGVDQQRLVKALSARFDNVALIPYWSTQSAWWQRFGELLARKNTFALVATGFRPAPNPV